MSDRHLVLGARGEEAAAQELCRCGYAIVAQRVRTAYGEIDLIAREGETWSFVEVKTRTDTHAGDPAEALHPGKQRRLVRAALAYLKEHHLRDVRVRFDVVTVMPSPQGFACTLIRDAFMPDSRYTW